MRRGPRGAGARRAAPFKVDGVFHGRSLAAGGRVVRMGVKSDTQGVGSGFGAAARALSENFTPILRLFTPLE